jgi:hypothetical protein
MSLFKQDYGRVGFLRRNEWNLLLNSNKGFLFQKIVLPKKNFVGPSLDSHGTVMGDLFGVEQNVFLFNASQDQQQFYEELKIKNTPASKEYVLVIIGATRKWKEDIKLLQEVLDYLEKEENVLKKEEHLVKKERLINLSLDIPEVLKRHFSDLFRDMEVDNLEFDQLIEKIKKVEEKVISEEHYLKDYLKKKEKEMPFLFE